MNRGCSTASGHPGGTATRKDFPGLSMMKTGPLGCFGMVLLLAQPGRAGHLPGATTTPTPAVPTAYSEWGSFSVEPGAGCGPGNDIYCGAYASQSAIEAACTQARRPFCVAYSMANGNAWCMKSLYTPGDVAGKSANVHTAQ